MFQEFPKIARLNREVIITEKIDGTNAQIYIPEAGEHVVADPVAKLPYAWLFAGSRNRFLKLGDDNFGFAKWVHDNAEELAKLGPGRHFGEWWGSGIQRGYGLPKGEKRFSLFNVSRWGDGGTDQHPACCHVVPVIARGIGVNVLIDGCLTALRANGSYAAPGFMKPEGVCVFHTAANRYFKVTLEKDEEPKSRSAA